MAIQAVMFDFNGTLFADSQLHIRAFDEFCHKHLNRSLYPGEFDAHILGGTNKLVMEYLFGRPMDPEEAEALGKEKEALYRSYITEDMTLVKGAERLFDELAQAGLPMAIVSATPRSNAEFYQSFFKLDRWFTPEQFVYLTPDIQGKPAPDLYLRGASLLGVNPSQCLVFEDSPVGILAAQKAGAAYIAAIEPASGPPEGVHPDVFLPDFDAFDRTLLKSL
ncbi:MAG: HAD family phosphatase [Clostridia bacterium]|nr:HAD family phosphatase [Clostridia bacterium]